EQHVHRCGSRREGGKVDVLQGKIALELLEQAGLLVEPRVEIAGDAQPLPRLLRSETETARKRTPLVRPAFRAKPRHLCGDLQLPAVLRGVVSVVWVRVVVCRGPCGTTCMGGARGCARAGPRADSLSLVVISRPSLRSQATVVRIYPIPPAGGGRISPRHPKA